MSKKKKIPTAFISLFQSMWTTAAETGQYLSQDLPKTEAQNLRMNLNIYRRELPPEELALYDHMMVQLIPSLTKPDHVQLLINGTGPSWSKPEYLSAITAGIKTQSTPITPDFSSFIPKSEDENDQS
jgi:hypothetical protein